MTETRTPIRIGRCLCGACCFELDGPPNWVGHCHCESCRRATASAFTTWLGQDNARWRFTGATPVNYVSSPGNRRGFCGRCGSPVLYQSERFPNETHFYVALLEDPNALVPAAHHHMDERLAWVHLADGLPSR